ncbi:MAG TPA: DUF1565 domain-containing protein [Nitrospirota bacterium]|nr:DUF1565 domain-containing protein [Nitrospirota bacterium]
MKRLVLIMVLFFLMAALLTTCSGGGGGGSSPINVNCTAPTPPVTVSATKIVSASVGNDATASGTCLAYKTITAALTAASSGDVVWVAPGTYDLSNGEVFPIKIPTGVSLIGDVTNMGNGITPTLIKGHGSGSSSGIFGNYYAALISGSTTTISGFEIDDTVYTLNSFAISGDNFSTVATDNTFLTNLYGGVLLQNGGNPVIMNNTFQSSSYGVYSGCTGTVTIQGNTFAISSYAITNAVGNAIILGNTITTQGWMGIQVENGSPNIQNNTFSSSGYGYGALGITSSPIVRNNTFNLSAGPAVWTADSATPDLGTALSPGNNIFSSVTGTVIFHGASTTIYAVGNTWPTTPPICGSQIITTGTGTVVWGTGGSNHCP